MSTLVTILHVIVCLFLMLTVLLQSGKGGGMGGAFGGSNAATVFGGSGASSFLRKLTAGAAIIFMSTSMILAYIASHDSSDALEKFGMEQAELARQKEEAKEKALQEGSAGSASPSEGGTSTMEPVDTPTTDTPTDSPATDTPATDTPSTDATDSAAPAETPAAPAETPAAPAATETPAAPATETPAAPATP